MRGGRCEGASGGSTDESGGSGRREGGADSLSLRDPLVAPDGSRSKANYRSSWTAAQGTVSTASWNVWSLTWVCHRVNIALQSIENFYLIRPAGQRGLPPDAGEIALGSRSLVGDRKNGTVVVNESESLEVLGLKSGATSAGVRQAYLDLVRVWHPDRFQADSRLQKIAEERLREINEAYAFLRSCRYCGTGEPRSQDQSSEVNSPPNSQTNGNTPRAETPHFQKAAWTSASFPARFRRQWYWPLPNWRKATYGTAVGTLCVVLPFAAVHVLNGLRHPMLATDALLARGLQPGIPVSGPGIDPLAELKQAAHSVKEWARGAETGVSKPAPSAVEPGGQPSSPGRSGKPSVKRPRTGANALSEEPLLNGTELLSIRGSSGAGELRLVNNTDLEAVVKLERDHVLSRAIYLRPHKAATLRSIAIGVYDLNVELGTGLDATHLRFQKDRFSPKPLGRFQFLEFTSEQGTSGSRLEVAINPR